MKLQAIAFSTLIALSTTASADWWNGWNKGNGQGQGAGTAQGQGQGAGNGQGTVLPTLKVGEQEKAMLTAK